MKKIYTLIFLIFPCMIFSQPFSGKITNKQGDPIQGVLIRNVNQQIHTHSNEKGYFDLLKTNNGDSIEISHLTYHSRWLVINHANLPENLEIILHEKPLDLEQVNIVYTPNPVKTLTDIDLAINPVNSSQEILRKVPGLFIGQHAGGGKAEQIFLRGFDIDHGTDVAISVDGMPVNMVSHAHGQGYADLHFLIPETIERIDFGKGPYYADKGNFMTAGFVNFQTKERISQSTIKLEVGQFQTQRIYGMMNLLEKEELHHAYIASEWITSNGPFESSQNFHRLNVMGKYVYDNEEDEKLSLSISHFNSEWTASGQIPQRAVKQGLISRFGTIDDTEGGQTSRTNIQLNHTKYLNQSLSLKNRIFYTNYAFDLFSNFTFFLRDTENGDQIRQRENRAMWGGESELSKTFSLANGNEFTWKGGVGLRFDDISDIGLFYTRNRIETLESIQDGEIREANTYAYSSADLSLGKWNIQPGIRVDAFQFNYHNFLENSGKPVAAQSSILSPKLNIFYSPTRNQQFFLKAGKGFHSNDSRLNIVPGAVSQSLPAAYGADLGGVFRLSPKLIIQPTIWYLELEQEFVYVGDEGIVEPSGRTRRMGADLSASLQIGKYLFAQGNVNYAHARSLESEAGESFIPLAPILTTSGGISFSHPKGFSASLQTRVMGNRPANEDGSIIAEGYWITDLNGRYELGRMAFQVMIENLFNQQWNETQFATESRLRGEDVSMEEIHFTPGTPFFARIGVEILLGR